MPIYNQVPSSLPNSGAYTKIIGGSAKAVNYQPGYTFFSSHYEDEPGIRKTKIKSLNRTGLKKKKRRSFYPVRHI